ncbi:MAG: metallophosphoesterase family protein [Mycobacterium leprae]
MTEKAAVLTDIHGNAPALRAVLADMARRGDIDRVLCLGDAIAIGPDTNEVLDLLGALHNLTMVTGNHEWSVLQLLAGRTLPPGMIEPDHEEWITDRLDPQYVPFLAALPMSARVAVGGRTVLLQHYHLDPIKVFASVDRQPSLERLESLYADAGADVICFGHHHIVHLFRSEQRLYLNPGALGCAGRPVARYGVLTLDRSAMNVELREVPYDNRAFLASYAQLGVPMGDFILQAFHGNQHKTGA